MSEKTNIICFKCKVKFVEVSEKIVYDYIDKELVKQRAYIEDAEFLRCPKCKRPIYPSGFKQIIREHVNNIS